MTVNEIKKAFIIRDKIKSFISDHLELFTSFAKWKTDVTDVYLNEDDSLSIQLEVRCGRGCCKDMEFENVTLPDLISIMEEYDYNLED